MNSQWLWRNLWRFQPQRIAPLLWLPFFIGGYGSEPCQAQWVISAIHPDPTPPMGAPEAEFVALLARGAPDSCLALNGYTLEWNGHTRALPDGCWSSGTVLVAHRAADSLAFDWGPAHPLPLSSWPALVNGGAMVALRDGAGICVDAMPYDDAALGGGGRPLMRLDPKACGGSGNQGLWEAGTSPFSRTWEGDFPGSAEATAVALNKARAEDRWVPRGPGKADWYLGTSMDPAFMLEAKAWVGGLPASIEWPSDSVIRWDWTGRRGVLPHPEPRAIPILVGPLRACPPGAQTAMFTHAFHPGRDFGPLEVVGALPDPVPGIPGQEEGFALFNPTERPIEVGSWTFGGARLRRNVTLFPDSVVQFSAGQFEGWSGMPNSEGALTFLRHGEHAAGGMMWDVCDYSLPAHVGSGLGLVRKGVPGAAWSTAGTSPESTEPLTVKGFGCIRGFSGTPAFVEVYLNRHSVFLPDIAWFADGSIPVDARADPEHMDGWRLNWPGMDSEWLEDEGVRLIGLMEGTERLEVQVKCPPSVNPEPLCVRADEMMWNARENGAEFVELLNCGTQPVDLRGLQGTTVEFPFPSDWDTWVPLDRSLVLLPGDVAAFGKCPGWMGFELPERGPSRWSVDGWSALNDQGGTLRLRLFGQPDMELDGVEWSSNWEGPWWWGEDGWAWVRSGEGGNEWRPSTDRGSPGAPQALSMAGTCEGVMELEEREGGLPGIHWRFPDAGGGIEIQVVHWPSGELVEHRVMDRPGTQGQWSWSGPSWGAPHQGWGSWLFSVRWWSGSCRGRQIMSTGVPHWK